MMAVTKKSLVIFGVATYFLILTAAFLSHVYNSNPITSRLLVSRKSLQTKERASSENATEKATSSNCHCEFTEVSCPPPPPPIIQEIVVEKPIIKEKIVETDKVVLVPASPDNFPVRLYEGFRNSSDSSILVSDGEGASNVIYYIWCGENRLFQFKHMLSVLSAMKVHQPMKVSLLHWPGKRPVQDLYNDWLKEIADTFYNFDIRHMHEPEPQNCDNKTQMAQLLTKLLTGHGGIYLNENVVLEKSLNKYRHKNIAFTQPDGSFGAVVAKSPSLVELVNPEELYNCKHDGIYAFESGTYCISMSFERIYPKDIMSSDVPFHSVARHLFYGSPNKKIPLNDLSNPIPNIGHFYLLGENFINFFTYLSISSMVNVLKVNTVYVHGDIEPRGDYWIRLRDTGKVKFVYCPPISSVFGNALDSEDKFHGKDILSVYFLYLYGGVFLDWDAIFTRPLDDSVRGYDVVIGMDWLIPEEAPNFPEVFNPGVLAAKRHSPFIAMWLDKYKEFGKGGFYYTGLLVPYKIYEHYPETVKVDDHFQVICWQKTCHPPWMAGYNAPEFNSEFEWETVYSVHFTYPDPVEFYNEKTLNSSSTMIAKMGQRVMGWI